jgi:hypothetical protein
VFFIANNGHVWLDRNLATVITGSTSLATFLERELDHSASWSIVRP